MTNLQVKTQTTVVRFNSLLLLNMTYIKKELEIYYFTRQLYCNRVTSLKSSRAFLFILKTHIKITHTSWAFIKSVWYWNQLQKNQLHHLEAALGSDFNPNLTDITTSHVVPRWLSETEMCL